MGYDLNLFVDSVDEELICCICHDVLKNAIQLNPCQHIYCKSCLTDWFKKAPKTTCPSDGEVVDPKCMSSIPRTVQNILSKLNVQCDRCNQVMSLSKYENHNCFQELSHRMVDYIDQIDKALMILQPNQLA